MTEAPQIGRHLAVLNLFREPDGTVEITVAAADGAMVEFNKLNSHLQHLHKAPIDYVEMLIVAAAETMAERRATPADDPA